MEVRLKWLEKKYSRALMLFNIGFVLLWFVLINLYTVSDFYTLMSTGAITSYLIVETLSRYDDILGEEYYNELEN